MTLSSLTSAWKEGEDGDAWSLDTGPEENTQYADPASQGRTRPRLPSAAAQNANTTHPEAEDAQFVDGLVDSLSKTPLENRSKNSPRAGGTDAEKKVAQAQKAQGINQRGRQLPEIPIQQWRSNPAADAGTNTGPPFLIVRRVVQPKSSSGRGKLSKATDTSEQQTDVSGKSFEPQLNNESQKQSQFNSGLLGNAEHTSDSAYQQQVSSNSPFKSHQNTLSSSKASLGAPALKGRPSSKVGIVGRVNTRGGGESQPGRGQISIKPKVASVKNSSPSRNGASAIRKPAVAAKKAKVSVHKNGESRITFKAQVEQTGPEETKINLNNPGTDNTNKTAATVSLKSSQTSDQLDSKKEKESDAAQFEDSLTSQIQRDRDTENTDSSIGSTTNTAQPKAKMQSSDDADDNFGASKETNSESKQPEIPSVSKQPQSLEATVSASFEDKRSGSSAIDTNAKTGLRQNTNESVSDGKVRNTETVEQYNPSAGNAHTRNNTAQEQELPRLNAGKSETKQVINPEQEDSTNEPLTELKSAPTDKSMTERGNVSYSFYESETPSSDKLGSSEETMGNKEPASSQEKVSDHTQKTSLETMNAMANTIGKSIGKAQHNVRRKRAAMANTGRAIFAHKNNQSPFSADYPANRNRKSTPDADHFNNRNRKSTSSIGNRNRKSRSDTSNLIHKISRSTTKNDANRNRKSTFNTEHNPHRSRKSTSNTGNSSFRKKRTLKTASGAIKSNTENRPFRGKRTIKAARGEITAHIESRPFRGKRTIKAARGEITAHIENRPLRGKRTIKAARGEITAYIEKRPFRNKRTINTARGKITAHIKNSPFRNKRTLKAASGAMVARKHSAVYKLPPGQIVAELTPEQLKKKGLNFVIGDGGTYNGFINSRLSSEGRYNVYVVANSEVEDIKFSVSRALAVSMPLEPSESRTIAGRRRDNYIVMGVMLSIAFIILLVMIWIKCQQYQTDNLVGCTCCRFDIPNQFWMSSFEFGKPMNRLGTPLLSARDQQYVTEERHWSDTHSLSEPRVITTGRELLLPSQVGMLPPSHQNPANAEPITFRKEFLSLPRVNHANPTLAGTMHKERNNTPTILPYDATRVVLDHDGTGGGDYYNASYLTGYMDDNGRRGTYIGAQCPFDEGTALDMWRLIYQHSVPTVVVLSKVIEDGVLKCFKFWPEVGRSEHGPFVLQAVDHFSYAHYTEHLVSVKKRKRKNEELVVRIFCFSSWPEKGVPQDSTPFVELCTRVHKSHGANTAPILVQCDTGSGRTAVFIAGDILLAQYATENQASVYDVVCALRSERPHMVQNFPQYAFIYQALLEEMHAGDTWVSEDLRERYRELSRHNANTGRTYLRDQFMMLELMLSKPEVKADPAKGDGPLSNSVPDLIPGKRLEFNIPTPQNRNASSNAEPPDEIYDDDDDNDSLEGLEPVAMVDGYRRKKQFLMTNTPLPSGVSDFWQYVYENDVRSIVVMEEPDPSMAAGRSRGEYWPMSGSRMWDPFLVELLDVSNSEEGITVRTFRVVHMHRTRDEPRTVRQFQFHGWTASPEPGVGRQARRSVLSRPPSHYSMMHDEGLTRGTSRRGSQCCPPPTTRAVLLCLNNMVRQWQDHVSVDSTPILVHCRDGVLCSGLFVALSLIAARMDEENLVSIYRVCRSIRKVSPHAIGNFDQYKFLYKVLWDYINLPPDGSPQEHFVPPLDSPEFEHRPMRGRYIDTEELPDYPEDSEDYVPGGMYGTTRNDGNFTAEPQEHDYYDTFATMEVMETEEETMGDCVARNSSYYCAGSRPTPTSFHRAHALSSLSSTNDESFRFTPHSFNPVADRPPRQGARYSGYPSPVKAPSPSSSQRRRSSMSPVGRRELPPTPNRTPPRTPSRTQPSSFLSRTPSPAPRCRPQSLSPVTQSRLHSPPQRKRRESAAGRMVGGDAPRTSPARERGSVGGRRGSTGASPARNRGSARASPAARDRGSTRSSPVRPSLGNSPVQVKSESVVKETTEMMDEKGVFYRQEVTDYIQELSPHDTTTTSHSDISDF
ncbi:hypothetical protein V1264_006841 [Littorina saxatilis]|uniref:Uncharacterized protein n=1 Tax=Littorina saxatilis TaxID=31220 RepID=A0AAN9AYD3_9CAEN